MRRFRHFSHQKPVRKSRNDSLGKTFEVLESETTKRENSQRFMLKNLEGLWGDSRIWWLIEEIPAFFSPKTGEKKPK
jgi:hypothetical protein